MKELRDTGAFESRRLEADRARTLVSIVSPFYNEVETIEELLQRIVASTDNLRSRYDFEFVLIDDGSRDGSLEVARGLAAGERRLRVVELRRNYGQTAALQAGLDVARGEIIITLDADLQHFPEEIPNFLSRMEEGFDVVCGWRHDRQEGIVRRWPSRVANYLLRKAAGLRIHDVGTTFRAYRREIIVDVRLLSDNHRFVPVFAAALGARIDEIPIQNIERPHGKSNYGLGRTINVLIDIFFVYFFVRYLDRPLRIFGKIALLTLGVGVVIVAVLTWLWLAYGIPVVRDHSGWFTLSATLLLASLQFLLAGVVGETVARVYFTSGRTTYKIRGIWPHDER